MAIGSIGLIPPAQSQTASSEDEIEVGYWIGVPFWGRGLIPEAVRAMQKHLGINVDVGCSMKAKNRRQGSSTDSNGKLLIKNWSIMDYEFKKVSSIDKRLKERMDELGMKQIELCRATGIDKGSISHYLAGGYKPKNDAIVKLATVLNVNEMWLYGYDIHKERIDEISEAVSTSSNLKIISCLPDDTVSRLANDESFCEAVKLLGMLDSCTFQSVKNILMKLVA